MKREGRGLLLRKDLVFSFQKKEGERKREKKKRKGNEMIKTLFACVLCECVCKMRISSSPTLS